MHGYTRSSARIRNESLHRYLIRDDKPSTLLLERITKARGEILTNFNNKIAFDGEAVGT